jgi:hypothetical protein
MPEPTKTPDAPPEPAHRPVPAVVYHVLSFAAGLLIALVLDYVLYRMGLPSRPFIYVAF